ncbi:Mitochondrial ribosomal protein L28 protein [Dioscorea alata]|uniref:Mitochondrial ribosomal protein L28 protein n=1 Tax=Dioscorea alata TaxID=55571 RepID=A0ACB7VTL3_DIOAL|nr:Mitochondrial ribosomal protein L28 protein [Dioscorea alata]
MIRSFRAQSLISSLKTLVQNPSHHLLQKSPVSGTAKGKAKLKAGQTLKRSILPKKKPSGSGGGGGGSSARGRNEELNRMVDSCLDAPTPIPHLPPKQRQREVEREKLGLISKHRQREIELKKSPPKEDPVIMGTPGLDYISLGLVDADKIPKYELTVEDGRRLAKEYSRVLMRKHRARQAAESTLLRLKKEAIAALPEKLREAAMVPDFTPFPANRFMATLTPPIEGYIEKVREAAKKYSVKEKLR